MEHILYLYALPYDPKRPLWCFDERPCQLLGDTLVPIPMKPGKKWRYDHHYERKGVCNILIAFQPHTGQRVVQVRQQRRAKEYAEFMVELKTVHNPEADTLQIVQDNLNTHSPSSFYTILPPAQALAMANLFEMNSILSGYRASSVAESRNQNGSRGFLAAQSAKKSGNACLLCPGARK